MGESCTTPRETCLGRLSAIHQHDIQPHQQAAVQAQHQVCGPTREEDPQLRSAHKGRPGTPGVYSVPCECCQVYIGQTGRSIETRIKEHQCHTRLEQPDKSTMAEYSINLGHRLKLQDTTILSIKAKYMDRMIR
jgi:hypothetical protein